MKLVLSILLTAIAAFLLGLISVLPWWTFSISSLLIAYGMHQKPGKSFFAGFVGVLILWLLLAIIKDNANEHILSTKVANILPLKGNYWLLIFIGAFVGALVSGFAALAGSYFHKAPDKR